MQYFSLVINFGLFLILSFLVFYLPGYFLIALIKKEIKTEENIFLSITLSIIIFICLAIILGLTRLRFGSLFFYLISTVFLIKKFSFGKLILPFKELWKNKKLVILLFLAILVMGFINFPSGLKYNGEIYFWSSQGHDGLWHVALMEEIKNNFPPQNPLYANRPLINYHFSVDILMGEFYRIFSFFNPLDLYFRFFPVLFSFLIGLGVYCFGKRRWDENAGLWAVFFTCFCGSFGYLVSVLKGGFLFTGETTFWASQGNTILGNPPHTLGIIVLTAFLVVLQIWQKDKEKAWLYLLLFLGFGLATAKVSSGLVLVLAFGITGFYRLIKEKKFDLFLTAFFLGLTNLILLKIISPSAESFLIFKPLWFIQTMMVAKLGNVDWELRRQHYIWKNTLGSFLHLCWLEFWAIILFIVGNTGLRVLGVWEFFRKLKKKIDLIDIFISIGLVVPLILVLLFIQNGIVFNLIQFMQIFFHFLGLLAGGTVAYFLAKIKKPIIYWPVLLLIIFMSIPTVLGNLFDFYFPGRGGPLAKVTKPEIDALAWLKNNSDQKAIILTVPFKGKGETRYKRQPWPISAWYSTSYLYVFSGRYAYLSGEEQLMITGYDTKDDLLKINNFFSQTNPQESETFIKDNNISYVYVRKDEIPRPVYNKIVTLALEIVFENSEVVIYKIRS